jgi:predicted AAA+ superfamily ATPase
MYNREITNSLLAASKKYPIVTITGPRQSGKTTLAKHLFPNKAYVNLEPLDIRQAAIADPRQFLGKYAKGAIIDEIQRVPELLSYLQVQVDEQPEAGQFILTGSHQFQLHQAITQSLAGRTSLLRLLPLSVLELMHASIPYKTNELLFKGGYPGLYLKDLDPTEFYRNYCQTYIERDVREILNITNLLRFQRFMKLSASRVGQLMNFSSFANDLGVAVNTIKEWLSILEASFLLFSLPPYFENFGKRIIKSPKYYFTDVGLASYLLDIESLTQIDRDPLRGALIENAVILEMIKYRLNQGLEPHLYFYRDNHQNEVDVIFKTGTTLIPIEIKSAQTFHPQFLKGLSYFRDLAPQNVSRGYVVYFGEEEFEINGFKVISFKNIYQIFENIS